MASCDSFSVPLVGDPADLATKVRTLIEGHGGTISGDHDRGSFSVPTPIGVVEGTYAVLGSTATLAITRRSFLLPCGKIRDFLTDHLPRVAAARLDELSEPDAPPAEG